jgi:hypothetical protein
MKNKFLFPLFIAVTGLVFASCEEDIKDDTVTKTVTMSAAQEVPAVVSSGTGTVSYTYRKSTKTLTYVVTWSGLTDSATAMHIHGLALRGQGAGVLQGFTLSTVQRRKEGTYTGNLYFDELIMKEAELYAGRYYLNLHSKAFPGGEIRAQIEVQ